MMAFHPTTGMKYYFVEKNLPFGSSISCSHFSRVSNAIEHIFAWHSKKRSNNYLDDFLFVALLRAKCDELMNIFLDICQDIQFPVALEKTEWARQAIVFLGFLIDSVTQTIAIPLEKRLKTLDLLHDVLESKKMTLKDLQRLTGLLNTCAELTFRAELLQEGFMLREWVSSNRTTISKLTEKRS